MSTGHQIAGRFRLLKELVLGTVSSVWLAEEELESGERRLVVLKRVLSHPFHWVEVLPEVRAAQRRRHPALIEHYEIFSDEYERGLIVLEYIPCRTLAWVLERAKKLRRPLPLSFAAWIAAQLCSALELFENPHRAISPNHVLLSFSGGVKLAGSFKAPIDIDYVDYRRPVDRGDFSMMSPEQVRGAVLDIRSDIFSLGALLWELATGERCFATPTDLDGLRRHRRADVRPPTEINPRVSAELSAVILRALARYPEHRFQTPAEMREALEGMAAPAPKEVAELFAAEAEEEKQLVARLIDPERGALEAKIIAQPGSPSPYLVLADWLQQKNDPRGEWMVLDHALRDVGQVSGYTRWGLRREFNGTELTEEHRALAAREEELLKKHGEYFVEGITNHCCALRHVAWRLGFIDTATIDVENWAGARETVAALAVAPSGRFLQQLRIADRAGRVDDAELGARRFECLRSIDRSITLL